VHSHCRDTRIYQNVNKIIIISGGEEELVAVEQEGYFSLLILSVSIL
jgi:hypothetical protein